MPRSGRHAGQADARSVADHRQAFKAHGAAADRPLVILLEHERAGEPDDGSPYNVANFQWRALWDRRSLKARYQPVEKVAAQLERSGLMLRATAAVWSP